VEWLMPFDLTLPKRCKSQGWKVKIRDKERVEPPHVTVMCHTKEWRISLRDRSFLIPPGGNWRELDAGVQIALSDRWLLLQTEWDRMYPENPINSVTDGETGDEQDTPP
jgi:hypothetical protein